MQEGRWDYNKRFALNLLSPYIIIDSFWIWRDNQLTGFYDKAFLLARIILGAVFIFAGVQKLADPASFAVIINGYGLIPESLDYPVAVLLPLLEVVSGIGLIFNIRGALSLVVFQLLLFVVVLGYGIHMGLDADCGCFGPNDPEGDHYHGLWTSLYRDFGMLAICALTYWHRRYFSRETRSLGSIFNHLKLRR